MEEKASVLIVDDNISLCRSMSLILGRKGYAVATAHDGLEAIERVKERPFDIIFLDVKMPIMDGVETHRMIKKIRPEAVVMMVTAYAVEGLVAEALREGAHGIIYKPLDTEKVVALIERVMETKKGALILVVDDDQSTCITFKNVLVKRGHKVAIARNGEEAIAMSQDNTYDILFIEMKLPTINGLETFSAIKGVRPEAVAVMMTPFRQEMTDLAEEARVNNAYACLYKPLDMAEVLRLVDEILDRE